MSEESTEHTAPLGSPGATGPLEPTVKAEPPPKESAASTTAASAPGPSEGAATPEPVPSSVPTGASDSSSASDGAASGATAADAKMVRQVVVSYRTGWLPGNWLQTW